MKYAKLPFKKLIQPAIDLAENGFAVTRKQAESFNDIKEQFIRLNTSVPVFVKDIQWKAGDTLVQKDLAGFGFAALAPCEMFRKISQNLSPAVSHHPL